ncbi:MAG: DNA replication/repair protein RecF [bacterium]
MHVVNFRNLADQDIELSSGFNFLSGDNGAGKTALLEAIHVLARGRSFRTHRIVPVVQQDKPYLVVTGEVVSDSGVVTRLGTQRFISGATELRVAGEKTSKASALAQVLPIQTLLPEAAELILGSPGGRRAFLDWGLFHVEQSFLSASASYRRVLSQRNAWLKQQDDPQSTPTDDPWFHQYRTYARGISVSRAAYVDELAAVLRTLMAELNPSLNIALSYDWGGLGSAAEADKKMSESYARDVKFGATQRGPHRGDLLFTADGHAAVDVVSRGQAKLIASAALLGQAKLLNDRIGQQLVFLIDDFGAELDSNRWQQLVKTLLTLNCQVVATSTDALDLNADWVKQLPDLKVFHVEQGRIAPLSVTQ